MRKFSRKDLREPFIRHFHFQYVSTPTQKNGVYCKLCVPEKRIRATRDYYAMALHAITNHDDQISPSDEATYRLKVADVKLRRQVNAPSPLQFPRSTEEPTKGGCSIQPLGDRENTEVVLGQQSPYRIGLSTPSTGRQSLLQPQLQGWTSGPQHLDPTVSRTWNSVSPVATTVPLRTNSVSIPYSPPTQNPQPVKIPGNQLSARGVGTGISMTSKDCQDLDIDIAKMVVFCGLSLDFVDSEYFVRLLRFSEPYSPPNRDRLVTTIKEIFREHKSYESSARTSGGSGLGAPGILVSDLHKAGLLHPDVRVLLAEFEANTS